jgi:hypothetical protein
LSDLPDEGEAPKPTVGERKPLTKEEAYKQIQDQKLEHTDFNAKLEETLESALRMSRRELIQSKILVRHPEWAPVVNQSLKNSKNAESEIIDEPVKGQEERMPEGEKPSSEFDRNQVTEASQSRDAVIRKAIQDKKESFVRGVAASGKAIIKIYGWHDNETNEDVWLRMECNYRDLMQAESDVLRILKAREIDIRRQLDYFDILRSKSDPDYLHIMEQLADCVKEWRSKFLKYYYGVKEEDNPLLHTQDVAIAIEAAIYREENIYPNFREESDRFFSK